MPEVVTGQNENVLNVKIIFRMIFEEKPLTISGLCMATNVAGTLKKYFTIKLLSLETTRILLNEDYNIVKKKNTVNDDMLTELDLEEIRHLRHQYDIKENKRIREQLKGVFPHDSFEN